MCTINTDTSGKNRKFLEFKKLKKNWMFENILKCENKFREYE